PHQQKQIRMQLASVIKAVVSQRLMPRADGKGRAPAVEVMIGTPFIRDCIVDKEKTHLIRGAIASGTSQYGMQTFDQSIFSLFEQGLVTLDEALRWASNVDEFKLKVQGIATTSEISREVAIKILPESFVQDPERQARFQREAQILGALNHPHIASIYGLEESGSTQFLVLELVEGQTLADRLARPEGRALHPFGVRD